MRGEWIEIDRRAAAGIPQRSLPMRGEWIEIKAVARGGPYSESLPMRGEWIEIPPWMGSKSRNTGLSPCGESGLKCRGEALGLTWAAVSPHAGRVD